MTKKKLRSELQRVFDKYLSEFGDASGFGREYFRQNSEVKDKDFCPVYGTWLKYFNTVIDKDELKSKKDAHKVHAELEELRKENKKLLKGAVTNESVLEEYKNRISPLEYIQRKELKIKDEKKTAVLLLSDWHLGEVVKSSEIMGINDVTSDIILERARKVFTNFKKYAKTIGLAQAVVYLDGDMVSGSIHQELESNSDLTVVEAVLKLNDYLTYEIMELSKQFSNTKVVCLTGNHARLKEKPHHKQKAILNHEFILGSMIQHNLSKQKNIECIVPRSPYYFDEKYGCLILHGDTMSRGGSGGFSGLPFYGLTMSSAKLFGALESSGVTETNFKNILIGHFHSTAVIPLFNSGSLIINGTLLGTNEFSLNVMKCNSNIEQLMLIIKNDNKEIESIIRLQG
jgi:hypothetical protein